MQRDIASIRQIGEYLKAIGYENLSNICLEIVAYIEQKLNISLPALAAPTKIVGQASTCEDEAKQVPVKENAQWEPTFNLGGDDDVECLPGENLDATTEGSNADTVTQSHSAPPSPKANRYSSWAAPTINTDQKNLGADLKSDVTQPIRRNSM